ncbi:MULTISPECIES: CoB--CoM heterodisulfide reductase iron-sulfur subunit A family protein [unclassified Methanoregula]|uniref:CoB--CoM heterodisulfide reductase iron-sulfur subunit A family protein n=1 Tax=unclassified Methanoregula TaxID=2649730 RepID=UPI0009CEC883|nr:MULTISPECIES: CoB--CoM heterodisulfide reductase iron-sulfur subunit A family protein [unclassified Methanoregula]OPX65551.1 MAG: CoB--CoM heterodisulfide reductase iron-sulfur subunit A [Methanoregula sp. PtaB.Bin085]OPY35830.1 MAG: CoB--CoM heterodisulfide reductase iron-sulfur subunit A [Methanoregula sp. PtaU1.Bin006]
MGNVVVIGAGVAGIQAALDIASHGIHVDLIEREPTIGGHMAMLDKTFPTNDCSMCILSPKMVDVSRHPNITIHTCTDVEKVEGEAGHFRVTVKKHPRYIDETTCTGCGDCVLVCPVEVYNRFDAGIGVRKAIYKPHPQAVPDIVVRDQEHCIECGLCYDVCGPGSVKREDTEKEIVIDAASIVLATGYEVFNPKKKPQLGHLTLPDVITSLELERMINAGGPTGGKVLRLSTGEKPKSIIFLQCVGSRDMTVDRPYCSCVCCMQAIKNAILIKEKSPDTDVTICYMDIRSFGKGYEEYYERAKALGVRFLRGMPSDIIPDKGGQIVQVENTETAEVTVMHPDLVVLSVGMEPAPSLATLAEKSGIPLEESGFVKTVHDALDTTTTLRPGIYVAGTAVAPKDIPDSVSSGGSAAMRAYRDAVAPVNTPYGTIPERPEPVREHRKTARSRSE